MPSTKARRMPALLASRAGSLPPSFLSNRIPASTSPATSHSRSPPPAATRLQQAPLAGLARMTRPLSSPTATTAVRLRHWVVSTTWDSPPAWPDRQLRALSARPNPAESRIRQNPAESRRIQNTASGDGTVGGGGGGC